MMAHMSTEKTDDSNTTYTLTFEYKLKEGVTKKAAKKLKGQLMYLCNGMTSGAKEHVEEEEEEEEE